MTKNNDTADNVFKIGSTDNQLDTSTPDTPDQLEAALIDLYESAMLHGEAQTNGVLPTQSQREQTIVLAKSKLLQWAIDVIGPDRPPRNPEGNRVLGYNDAKAEIRNNLLGGQK